MTIALQRTVQTMALVGWETFCCLTTSCTENVWHLRRQAPGRDVWEVYERPGWVIAATAPVCPACGTTLVLRTRAASSIGSGQISGHRDLESLRTRNRGVLSVKHSTRIE